jgi:hypothetical protein
VTLRLDVDLLDALKRLVDAQRYRTTMSDALELAVQELLIKEGFWPKPN